MIFSEGSRKFNVVEYSASVFAPKYYQLLCYFEVFSSLIGFVSQKNGVACYCVAGAFAVFA